MYGINTVQRCLVLFEDSIRSNQLTEKFEIKNGLFIKVEKVSIEAQF